VVHRPCTVSAVGRTNAANVEWRSAFAKAIVAWCIGLAPSVQLGGQMPRMLKGIYNLPEWSLRGASALHRRCSWRTNAANDEWRLAFAKVIVAWCIGPAPSVQLGGQMPQTLNGIRHLLKRLLRSASALHCRCSWAVRCHEFEWP
jgi:hypothetical protein